MKTYPIRLILYGFVIFVITSYSYAQKYDTDYDLLLKFGNINLQENTGQYISDFNIEDQNIFEGYYNKIVQFYTIPSLNQKADMEQDGLIFLDYIPHKAYTVAFPLSFDISLLSNYNIRSITDIIPEYKQSPALLDNEYPQWALRGADEIAVIVNYYANVSFSNVRSAISSMVSANIQNDEFSKSQIVQIKISDLEELINKPFVGFVEPIYPPGEPENYTGKTLHTSNVIDSEYDAGRHYDGTGVHVMLQDDGIIGPHIDYEGRIGEQYITSNSGDHGDHVAGTIFGAGNLDPTTTGMAPGAELYTYGAAPTYPGFNLIPLHYTSNEIRISSTSYSNGCNAGYTSLARTMDQHIRDYPALMHVFSAGNAGTDNCGYGAGPGWGNVTGGHKIGKNVIATANLDYKDALSNSSSRGPAHDGRIKPDISAKGSAVYSTTNPNSYTTKSGTSMACPGISGSLAQLYQAYKELNSGQEPKGGLIKALVLNTAKDLGNTGPDFKFGWGRINNLRAVMTIEESRYFTAEISQGEINTHQIIIPGGTKLAKIMVYWTDKEASVGTSKALVNDLDIVVTDPSNDVHYPWLLSHYPDPDSLNKPAVKGIDHLNNMEQVAIEDPQPGTFNLNIEGFEVPFGPQEYYVVYEFLMDEITVTYPQGGESFAPNESVTLRWDAYGDDDNFTIEYTLDNGANWTIINDNVNGSLRYFNWLTPLAVSGEAKIRVSRNGISDSSVETFSVMDEIQNIDFVRSCPNSVLISWNPVQDAVSYDVFMLGEKYMEIIGSTPADSMLIEGISYEEEYWFSVRAVGPNNAKGRRSIAEMKESGIWNCLFEKDIAVTDIIAPPVGVIFNCQDFSDLNVKMEIKNYGQESMSNFPVFYQFENEPVVSEVFTGTLEPGEGIIYEFNSSISITSNGIYDISVWIDVPGDENSSNDIIEAVSKMKTAQTMPNFELVDFDEFNSCSYEPDCEDISCYIDNKWYNLQNNLNDQIDWRILNGITPTPNTGPIGDHTTGTIEGNFLYLEASGECYNKKAVLMSPCINLENLSNPGMIFWFNMYGADMGSLHVDVISQGELVKDIILPINGNFGTEWNQGVAYFADFAGETINVRFRGITGNGELSDLAIDDITITEMTSVDNNLIENNNLLTVYPNPSSGEFTVISREEFNKDASLHVMDITGRIIYKSTLNKLVKDENTLHLSLSGAEKGIYYLVIKNGENIAKKKLIKY